MSEITINFETKAEERIEQEIEAYKSDRTKSLHVQIGKALLELFKDDPKLAELYNTNKRTLNSCYDYCYSYARNHNIYSGTDETLMGWVIHYIQDEPISEVRETYKLTISDEEELKKKAYEEYLEEEKRRLRALQERKEKAEQELKEAKQKKAQEKFEKIKGDQMTLFDL